MLKYFASLLVVTLTTGCASYRAQTLTSLSPESAPYSQTKEGIEVSCKAFTIQECKRYLDRDVLAKGVQPVQITVNNNSLRTLSFSKNNISLPCADPYYVASQVHTSTVGRSTAYGVGALFFWPLAIPAIVDGVKSSNANDKLDNDFALKSPSTQSIPPHGHLTGLIFVPLDSYQPLFTLTLIDRTTQEPITFTLNAPRN